MFGELKQAPLIFTHAFDEKSYVVHILIIKLHVHKYLYTMMSSYCYSDDCYLKTAIATVSQLPTY